MTMTMYQHRTQFLSTPSARRATRPEDTAAWIEADFYPRPPRGGRPGSGSCGIAGRLFLSTPSARRATGGALQRHTRQGYFYPRPPRGGRPSVCRGPQCSSRFLSTPSARRATTRSRWSSGIRPISIHALREEGDASSCKLLPYFIISIHALREEGDNVPR